MWRCRTAAVGPLTKGAASSLPPERGAVVGQQEPSPCRFFRADFRPCRVSDLANPQGLAAATSLPERKSAAKKLLRTFRRAMFEGFLVRRTKPCWRKARTTRQKAPDRAAGMRHGFGSCCPLVTYEALFAYTLVLIGIVALFMGTKKK